MSARVLVVDDIPVNVRLLEAKLSAEYYDVITANSGAEALEIIKSEPPDIVLLDVMMPEMDGFEVCRRIKADPATALLPVIMVTALNEQSDRVTGLEAGADDFLTKPVRDLALFARLRSLLRVKMLLDELRLREETSRQMNTLRDVENRDDLLHGQRVLFVGEESTEGDLIASIFDDSSHVDKLSDSREAMKKALEQSYDIVFVSLSLSGSDPLRLCSQLRSHIRDDIASVPIKAATPEGTITVTVSVGVAMRESTSELPDRQLKRADEALYEAKRGGRDCVVIAA